MAAREYRTAPVAQSTMPTGIAFIIGNEAAERFSFYGMKAILTVYMTKYLLDAAGKPAPMSPEDAKSAVHLFVASAYFFPLLGALLSDWLLGKYRTILALSLVYCLGHFALAVLEPRLGIPIDGRVGLAVGLTLIAIGAGGIKPCVSAHVGDQFSEQNQHLQPQVFGWFYFSINFGAFFSTLLTPWLLTTYGPEVAFGIPGVLMAVATLVFWLGRYRYAHVPPGGAEFLRQVFTTEGLSAVVRLLPLYLFISIFWALFDQTGAAWVLQAQDMDRRWLGIAWDESQIQAVNPILVLILIPLFTLVVYPLLNRVFRLTPLRKVAIGMFLMVLAYCITAMAQERIDGGETPSIQWQLWAYVLLTAAEVLVSITCLEFSYTQAPNSMKSVIMALYLLSVSLGNLLTSAINQLIQRPDGTVILQGADYYWFFTALMLAAAIGFLGVVATYRERTYVQTAEAGPASDDRDA